MIFTIDSAEDDMPQAIADMLFAQRALLERCMELAALEGSLAEGRDGFGRPCLIHRFTDPLTGRKKSRQLARDEKKLTERLKLSRLSRKMIPLLVYNIKQTERLAAAYRAVDVSALMEELPPLYGEIACDLRAFAPGGPGGAPRDREKRRPAAAEEKDI